MQEIELGDAVKCKITGFRGIVIGRAEYLHGATQLSVLATTLSDGKPMEPVWINEARLECEPLPNGLGFGRENLRKGKQA